MSISYEDYDRGIFEGTIHAASIPGIERYKYNLTQTANQAVVRADYAEVCRLKRELASICRGQGKEDDAYQLEHDAFLYEQMWIYHQAKIPISIFSEIPYVEKLKEALGEGADWADIMWQTDYAVSFRQLNARICRAQGLERDAYLLDNASYIILEKAGRLSDWEKLPDREIEEECLKKLAQKYGSKLSEDTEVVW